MSIEQAPVNLVKLYKDTRDGNFVWALARGTRVMHCCYKAQPCCDMCPFFHIDDYELDGGGRELNVTLFCGQLLTIPIEGPPDA